MCKVVVLPIKAMPHFKVLVAVVRSQGPRVQRKVSFKACHSGKLQLECTRLRVTLYSTKTFF